MQAFSAQECVFVLNALGVTPEDMQQSLRTRTITAETAQKVIDKCEKLLIPMHREQLKWHIADCVRAGDYENCFAMREQAAREGVHMFYDTYIREDAEWDRFCDFYESSECWCGACPEWEELRLYDWISSSKCPYSTCWHARCAYIHGGSPSHFECNVVASQECIHDSMHSRWCICDKEECRLNVINANDDIMHRSISWQALQAWYPTCKDLWQAMLCEPMTELCNPTRVPEELVTVLFVWYSSAKTDAQPPSCICGQCD